MSVIDALSKNTLHLVSILVIEDEPGDFGLVEAYLRLAGFWLGVERPQVTWAKTLSEAIAVVHHQRPDIVLLDLSLPDSSGLRTVEAMNAILPDVPLVIFTGQDDNDLAIAALECGAQDYLIKGQFDHHVLGRTLRYALVRGKLESRLRLFEVALNSAANGIVITDIHGRIQWVNSAFTQLTGYLVAEALDHDPSDLVKSGHQDQAFYKHLWETILSGQVWGGEVVNKRKDGSLYEEALSIAPVIKHDGTIQHFVAIKQDVTESKRVERQLRQSEQRLELALAGSSLGLWDWHIPSGEMVFDERWCAMLGYRKEEIEPQVEAWERLVCPDDWRIVRMALDAHLKGDTPAYEAEYRLRHKEGHWVWVLDRGKVMVRDAGNPLRAAGTHLDISHTKRLSLESSHLLKRIESLIRAATSMSGQDSERPEKSDPLKRLSDRQRQVLELVAMGCTSLEIAERMNISTATAVTHRRDLMRKLDLHSVAELIRFAMENKLV
ncbi:histidine kinase [Gammaproteobacteria bacterium]